MSTEILDPRRHGVRVCVHSVLLATAFGLAATAASGAEPAADVDNLEQVVVTGSRLGKHGLLDADAGHGARCHSLQELGITNIGAGANQLPAFRATTTPTTNGWGSFNVGAQIVNLRGLGVTRNLVLVDGRRFAPVTREGTVDLNLVPSGLVEAPRGRDGRRLGGVRLRCRGRRGERHPQQGPHRHQGAGRLRRHRRKGTATELPSGHWRAARPSPAVAVTSSWVANTPSRTASATALPAATASGGVVVANSGVGAVGRVCSRTRSTTSGGFIANPRGVINLLNNNRRGQRPRPCRSATCSAPAPSASTQPARRCRIRWAAPASGSTSAGSQTPSRPSPRRSSRCPSTAMPRSAMPTSTSPTTCGASSKVPTAT